jgi:predicted nucleotidyltransferase
MGFHHVQDRYPDLYHLLVTWRDELVALLGENLVAVYVMGSLFMGDFAEASSDVDFLVVTVHTPTQKGVEQLARLHTRLSDISPWGARLEGAYAAECALRPWGIDGTIVAIEPGGPLCEGPSDYSADNMLALRDHSITLYGSPATRVIPPVDRATLEDGLRANLEDLIERASSSAPGLGEAASWLLNIARCLFGLQTGRPCTKTEAAQWLAARDPVLQPALAAALAVRRGERGPDLDEAVRAGLQACPHRIPAAHRARNASSMPNGVDADPPALEPRPG